MPAWEFAKALHLQRTEGWARFVSMQDHYNLLAREEEREMIPLCLDEGVGTIVWSPLARGRLGRAWDDAKATTRSSNDGFADMLYTPLTEQSDHAIIDAVGNVAEARGVTRAQIALAWLHSQPIVTAPLVGASRISQIDDAVASLDIALDADEIRSLETPYTPATTSRASPTTPTYKPSWPAYPNSPLPHRDCSNRRCLPAFPSNVEPEFDDVAVGRLFRPGHPSPGCVRQQRRVPPRQSNESPQRRQNYHRQPHRL